MAIQAHRVARYLSVAVLAWLSAPATAQRQADEQPTSDEATVAADDEWVRLRRNEEDRPAALQTAIGRYEGAPPQGGRPVVVDLVGAIHVGDRAYYRDLNRRFADYDAVLYELVAPEGTVVPRGGRVASDNPLGAIQNGMKSLLDLEHQLEVVDYTKPHFVHADMSPERLFATMQERDEGFIEMYFRMVGQGIAQQSRAATAGESTEIDLFRALFTTDRKKRARKLKVALSSQLTQLESLITSFGGEDGSTLIQGRNVAAMDVLEREIVAGKRRLAVFYGAGHLTDMHDRLVDRFGLHQTEKEWVDAWDLSGE